MSEERIKEEVIIEVPYILSYREGFRDEAIKAAEKVPLGLSGAGYEARMKHTERWGAKGRLKSDKMKEALKTIIKCEPEKINGTIVEWIHEQARKGLE